MSEQPTIFMYGFKPRADDAGELNAVGKWLSGEDVELGADDLLALRREFAMQERYRERLLQGLMRVSRMLSERGAESTSQMEQPAASQSEVFWRGHACGKTEAYGMAAASVSELHVIAALGLSDG